MSPDKETGTIMSPTSEPTKMSVSPELRVYLEMISTCQIETKQAIKTLTEENHQINKEQAELWTGFKSLCSNHDSVLCTIDAKMNSTESKLLAKSQDFHDKITYSSVADMRLNLQTLMKKFDSHSSNTSANLSACMDRLDKFDLEINKLTYSLVSTQTELTILRSTVPPPNYQPSTPSNNGFIIPPITPSIHVPGIMQGNNTYQPANILDNNSGYGTQPGTQHNNPNVQGQSNKVAKIRNRYNQVPHLIQDTNGKVTNSQKTPQTRAKRSALSQQVTTKHI